MTAPVSADLGQRPRFKAIEAAMHAEFGIEFRVSWTFLTSQVEPSRVDGGPMSAAMFASFQRLWDAQAGGVR